MQSNPTPQNDGISTREARLHFAELLGRTEYAKERIKITRHGKTVAYLVPVEDIEVLQAQEGYEYQEFAAKIDKGMAQLRNGEYLEDDEFEAEMDRFVKEGDVEDISSL